MFLKTKGFTNIANIYFLQIKFVIFAASHYEDRSLSAKTSNKIINVNVFVPAIRPGIIRDLNATLIILSIT